MTRYQRWYRKNKRKRYEYMKAYRAANIEKVRANKRTAYHRNPKKTLARNKRWRKKNHKKYLEYLRLYYLKHHPNAKIRLDFSAKKKPTVDYIMDTKKVNYA